MMKKNRIMKNERQRKTKMNIKLSKRDMNIFSERLNDVFGVLNNLTDSEVFQSTVFEWNGDNMIHIKVCGRDSVWNEKLDCIDFGMCCDNDFIEVLKGVESPMSSPSYSHLLPTY